MHSFGGVIHMFFRRSVLGQFRCCDWLQAYPMSRGVTLVGNALWKTCGIRLEIVWPLGCLHLPNSTLI